MHSLHYITLCMLNEKRGIIALGDINKQTFLHGALILMVANIIVKIIGLIFRIPIYHQIGGEGWSYYQTAHTLYVYFFSIATAGLPIAISKMISIANMEQNYEEEKRIFRLSLFIFITLGIIVTSSMIGAARFFAEAVAVIPEAYYSILVFAPALFFVCLTASFRGYFHGKQNMIPTAISEVIESLGKLLIGLGAVLYAISRGYELYIVAAFAMSGLTVGVVGGFIFLSITKFISGRRESKRREKESAQIQQRKFKIAPRSNKEILREIIKIALPITLSASLIRLSAVVDTFVMVRRLIAAGYTEEAARTAFGDYSAQAVTIFNFPNVLIIPFAVSIIPVLSQHFASKNKMAIQSTVESTFRVVSIISMPCAFGIASLSVPILSLMFVDRVAVAATAPLLSVLALSVVFVSIAAVTNSMLQAQGQERKTVISTGCGILVKLVSSYILVGIPEIGRFGVPIGTFLLYFTVTAMNFYFLVKYTGIVPPIRRTFMKPFMASAIMAICTILIYMFLNNMMNGSRIATLLAILVGAVIYAILTLLFKTLKRDDVLLLPKGEKLYAAMKRKNLID